MNEIMPNTAPVEITPDPLFAMIERIHGAGGSLPVDTLNSLMDVRERQMNKEAEQEFNRDFAAASAELPVVKRTGKNNHTGNRYATLDDLIKAARPVLAKHELALNWTTESRGDEIAVTAIVRHKGGHSISTTQAGRRDAGKQMNYLQGGGSTETYLKRYTGFSILGMAAGDEVDDDGASARKPNVETISEAQYLELREALHRVDGLEEKCLKTYGIAMLAQLPASRFKEALYWASKFQKPAPKNEAA